MPGPARVSNGEQPAPRPSYTLPANPPLPAGPAVTSLTEIIQAGRDARVGGPQTSPVLPSGAPRPAGQAFYPTSVTGSTLRDSSTDRPSSSVLSGILLGTGTANAGTGRAPSGANQAAVPEPYSPVAAALAETRNRQREARAAAAQADYRVQSTSHQYGAPGVVRVANQFTEQLNEQQRAAAQSVFDILNLPTGVTGSETYNVGTSKESLARYRTGAQGTKAMKDQASANGRPTQSGRQEGTSDVYGDVQDLRVGGQNASQAQRPIAVVNTIAGGVAQFQQMSVTNPDAYNSMVYRLWSAGLITGSLSEAGLGGWTSKTGKSLAGAMSAVAQLNSQGVQITLDEYLDNLSNARGQALAEEQAAGGGGGGGGVSTPAPRSYTSREEVNARLKSTAQEILGRSLSDDEADRFAAAFRGQENAAYDKAEADQDYENPNTSASAQAYVEDNNETEAASFRIQGFMERLKSEMGL